MRLLRNFRRVAVVLERSGPRFVAPILLCAWLMPTIGLAQGNLLLTNPEFDDGLAGWSTGAAQSSTAAGDVDDCPASFSFHGVAIGPTSPSVVRILSPDCIPVVQGDVLELELTYRAEAPVHLEAALFGGTNCSTSFLAELGPALPAEGDWTTGRRTVTVEPANATGVRFAVIARIDPGPRSFMLDVDRPFLGRRQRVFSDDFEAASICRWSNAD
jgi:hypothetical protein